MQRVRLDEFTGGRGDGRDGGSEVNDAVIDLRSAREELRSASAELRARGRELERLAAQAGPPAEGLGPDLLTLMRVSALHDDPPEAARAVADVCAGALDCACAVSIAAGSPAQPRLTATSSRVAQLADGAQVIAGEGPAHAAWDEGGIVVSDDVAADERWPHAARLVRDIPVHGVIAAPLRLSGDLLGVLAAYQSDPGVDPDTVGRVGMLSDAVAAVLTELERRQQTQDEARQHARVMETRPTIDMAKGIVMAVRRCGPDEAFTALVRASQTTNTKLHDIAATIVAEVAEGRLPTI